MHDKSTHQPVDDSNVLEVLSEIRRNNKSFKHKRRHKEHLTEQYAAERDESVASDLAEEEGEEDYWKLWHVEQNHDLLRSSFLTLLGTPLLLLECEPEGQCHIRSDMNRLQLLEECRGAARRGGESDRYGYGQGGAAARTTEVDTNELQLRDLRRLMGLSEQRIVARKGALVISLGALNGIVTPRVGYVVVPDGAEVLLTALMSRLDAEGPDRGDSPFELYFLESMLHTITAHQMRAVLQCKEDAAGITSALHDHNKISSKMTSRIWLLKRRINEVTRELDGVLEALEELQEDDAMMHMLYLSAADEDEGQHAALMRHREGNTERAGMLVDVYAMEFHSLSTQLLLVHKQIDATEDLLKLRLNITRNNLWKIDILVGMASMWISAALFFAGLAGMNVHMGGENYHESPYDHTAWRDCGDCKEAKGPSWLFFDLTVATGGGAAMLILLTAVFLWRHGYLMS